MSSISLLGLLELVGAARDQQRDPAGLGDLERRRLADPARGAGDQHRLAVDGALEAAVLEQVGVEVALPVVPQLGGVALERRHRDPRAGQRPLGVAGVELGGQPDVAEHLVRDPEVGQDRLAHALGGRQLHEHPDRALGQRLEQLGVDPHRHLRRVRGLGDRVHHLARALGLGVGEVERLAVEAVLVGDVVHARRRRSRPGRCSCSRARGRPAGTSPAGSAGPS